MSGRREPLQPLGRRAFLHRGTLLLTGSVLGAVTPLELLSSEITGRGDGLRIGLITDLHYADKAPAGTRFYRETLRKLPDAAAHFEEIGPAFVVELGDLIDSATSVEEERIHLSHIQRELATLIPWPRHYVLGNHCVDTLRKDEFLADVGQERSYYSFDAGGYHFVILDACFREDGVPYGRKNSHWTDSNLPEHELEWLRTDLAATPYRTIVFAHQRLDAAGQHAIRNAPRAREILEASTKVLAVFQGHSHRNDYQEIAGIHYCTLVAMVEGSGEQNNGYSVLELLPDDLVRVTGFRNQASYDFPG